ncbi:MAG: acetate--CoA ligase family protein [Blastomonas sp.]
MTDVMTRQLATGKAAVELLLRPGSVAVIGVSAKPRSAGRTVLQLLQINNFAGDIHLVGRSGGDIDGIPVLPEIDDLPEGIDLAIFALPAAGVKAALEACVRRGVRAVTIFSSGFAEVGNREGQDELVRIAREGGVAMLGPNCLGYTNFVDGFAAGFAAAFPVNRLKADRIDPAIAYVSQSGGLMAYARATLEAVNLPTAYSVSTGNEAGVGLADFIEFFADDPAVGVISLYLEEVRDPQAFMAAASYARSKGKPVVMIHPGRSAEAQAAVQSHTGALTGDYDVMRVHLAHAGVALTDTLEQWADVTELMARFPEPPVKGPGIVTFSGGFCAIAHDYCSDIGLEVPDLSPHVRAELAPQLPDYLPPNNPLDLGTESLWKPEITEIGTKGLIDDPAIGSVAVCLAIANPPAQRAYGAGFINALKDHRKPAIFALPNSELDPDFEAGLVDNRIIFSRSAERTIQSMALATFHGRALQRSARAVTPEPFAGLPALGKGTIAEWQGKELLRAIGISVPPGGLATSADEAVEIAEKVGYPVAIKAQSAALAHKTEAGGVILNLGDADALRKGWDRLHDNIRKAQPGLSLDGVLVEKMAAKGLELVVGARRDPKWGPVMLVGLGGVWIEAIGDVRLMPCDLAEEDIVAEIRQLRSAKLLGPFRGAPPVDVVALARTASLVGRLMLTRPEIVEIDINPVFAHAEGEGVTAVDALIVTAP